MVLRWVAREAAPAMLNQYRQRYGAQSTLADGFVNDAKRFGWSAQDQLKAPTGYDNVTKRLWQDHAEKILPGLLHYGDSISMAHAIESRLPFLDYRLVEWLFSRGSDLKVRDGQTKWVLREYLNRYGPAAIATRPDKLGYPTPIDKWLAANDFEILNSALLSRDSRLNEYCDPMRLRRMVGLFKRDASGVGNHIYRLLSTEFWLRRCIDL